MHSSPEALRHRPQRWLRPAGFIGLGLVVVILIIELIYLFRGKM